MLEAFTRCRLARSWPIIVAAICVGTAFALLTRRATHAPGASLGGRDSDLLSFLSAHFVDVSEHLRATDQKVESFTRFYSAIITSLLTGLAIFSLITIRPYASGFFCDTCSGSSSSPTSRDPSFATISHFLLAELPAFYWAIVAFILLVAGLVAFVAYRNTVAGREEHTDYVRHLNRVRKKVLEFAARAVHHRLWELLTDSFGTWTDDDRPPYAGNITGISWLQVLIITTFLSIISSSLIFAIAVLFASQILETHHETQAVRWAILASVLTFFAVLIISFGGGWWLLRRKDKQQSETES